MTLPLFEKTIEERFRNWVSQNPRVIDLYLRFAREARNSGMKRYGVKAIAERVRWHIHIETHGDSFKVNNSYSAPMARYLTELDSSLKGFFEFRKRRS